MNEEVAIIYFRAAASSLGTTQDAFVSSSCKSCRDTLPCINNGDKGIAGVSAAGQAAVAVSYPEARSPQHTLDNAC
jgi:hypothetical protein